jgi:hypothetical protein
MDHLPVMLLDCRTDEQVPWPGRVGPWAPVVRRPGAAN